jgi:uncharacterized protein YjbI with pentapeptide repeats
MITVNEKMLENIRNGEMKDLRGADLTEADLIAANLRGAYLNWAILIGADLYGADLTGADLTGAKWDDTTRWPEGFTPPAKSSEEEE